MQIALISSTKDPASVNIKETLLNDSGFVRLENKFGNEDIYGYLIDNKDIKLYTIDTEMIFANDLDKKIDADVFIFLSKHKAADGRASLTCHPIGNFGNNEKGGKEKTLCICPSNLLKDIFLELSNNVNGTGYEATLEATHHGPFMEKPILFFELGSTEKHWNDKKGAKIYVKTLMNVLRDENKSYESVFVIGGTHYNHVANKTMLKTDFAVGHILPKHNFENFNEDILKQLLKKTMPKPKFALLDWKGLGKEKQRILDLLKNNNIEFKRSDRFFE
ncbi:hypothetical protein HYU09_01360 [Candidatus Woesearchaeota archaeon]|nr:hypothetical protein [Candidatus Woesearchaeota archaeon]